MTSHFQLDVIDFTNGVEPTDGDDCIFERQPMEEFHYRNLGNMATIGRNAAIADLGWLRVSGFPAWVMWLFIHIFWLIGFRNRLLVMVQWASAYLTYQRSVRLITGHLSAKDL